MRYFTRLRVALIIALERQVEDFCLLARKVNQLYPKIKRRLPDDVQNQKDSLVRQNEFLEVPLIFMQSDGILRPIPRQEDENKHL